MDAASTRTRERNEQQTWLSLLLGSALWFLHLNLTYGLASLACKWGWFDFDLGPLPGLVVVGAVITLFTLPLMAVLIYLPWREWRKYQTEKPADNPGLLHDTEQDRRPLVAFVTMLLNSLYFIFVIAAFAPILALNPCV
jgi:hypothetical protein